MFLAVSHNFERLVERNANLFGDGLRVDVVLDHFEQHDKLVAADARGRVGLADHAADTLGHGLEQEVADRVSEVVVDRLETVEINEQHRHPFIVPAGGSEGVFGPFDQQAPVGQPGQRIVPRQRFHLLAPAVQLGDLLLDLLAHAIEATRQNADFIPAIKR